MFVNARFLTQKLTGVQRYASEICKILKEKDPSIRFVAPKNIVEEELANDLDAVVYGKLTGHAWEQFELPLFLRSQGSPLLLCLCNTAPIIYGNKIVTIHDVVFEHFPNAVSFKFRALYRFLIPRIIKTSKALTTVSEFSKNDISRKYDLHGKDILVIYNSVNRKLSRNSDEKENVILSVGSLQPYKNINTLVDAFILYKKLYPSELSLKLVGGKNTKVFSSAGALQKIEGRKDIYFTGYLTDEDLFEAYSKARCFVFPSFFEGFGIPPLEAMSCSCPVLASDSASIPEICGDAALYFDPESTEDLVRKLELFFGDETLKGSLVGKGILNLERFSWEKSACQLLDAVRLYR